MPLSKKQILRTRKNFIDEFFPDEGVLYLMALTLHIISLMEYK